MINTDVNMKLSILFLIIFSIATTSCSAESDASYKVGHIPASDLNESKHDETLKYGRAVSITKPNLKEWMGEMNAFYAEYNTVKETESLTDAERFKQAIVLFNAMLSNDVFARDVHNIIDDYLERDPSYQKLHPDVLSGKNWYIDKKVSKDEIIGHYESILKIQLSDWQRYYNKNPDGALAKFTLSQINNTLEFYSLAMLESYADNVSMIGANRSFRFKEGMVGVLVYCCNYGTPSTAMLFDEETVSLLPQIDVTQGREVNMSDIKISDGYFWEI